LHSLQRTVFSCLEICQNDFLSEGTGTRAAGLIDVFRHAAAIGVAFGQTGQNLRCTGIVVGGKEILQLLGPGQRGKTVRRAGAQLTQPDKEVHYLRTQILFLCLGVPARRLKEKVNTAACVLLIGLLIQLVLFTMDFYPNIYVFYCFMAVLYNSDLLLAPQKDGELPKMEENH
jgi:hypothetical protein